ncbi:MAG: PQQ-binding-like beta-propeller repeat protein [Phycisphaerae bacterium]|jgi:outer membrane protein assembly factor BamB
MFKTRVGKSCVMAGIAMTIACSVAAAAPPNWPQFRGPAARGVMDGKPLPTAWDVKTGENIRWKTAIPGLAHASPIVWGDRIFTVTAATEGPEPYLRVGRYGESPDHPEKIVHEFRVYCFDRTSGKILWHKTAHSGIPKVKRHIKSTHANSTPATDGEHVVAFFGSEGLYCFDMDGKLLWNKDLGLLDSGAFNAPEVQWAFGSSPVIHDGQVITQCDVNNQSFIASFDVATGEENWRTPRDVSAGWGTPTVHSGGGRTQVIANGYRWMGGYDFATGKELWRLSGGGDVPVPTPYVADDLIFITNAHGPLNPIYAIRSNATGDITLKGGKDANEFIAWSRPRRGCYIPTTIVYGGQLYVADDKGILTAYRATTGEQVFRKRVAGKFGSYSASPVAGDGKLYLTDESGEIWVVKAGSEFELLANNQMGEECLATPAIADGTIYWRTRRHLVAVGN